MANEVENKGNDQNIKKAKLETLEDWVIRRLATFMKYSSVLLCASIGFLLLGWLGYCLIDGYHVSTAIRMHVHVITALSSPFDPVSDKYPALSLGGKTWGFADLTFAWLLLPTLLPMILTRAEDLRENKRHFYDDCYAEAYEHYERSGKQGHELRKSARHHAKAETKKWLKNSKYVAKPPSDNSSSES